MKAGVILRQLLMACVLWLPALAVCADDTATQVPFENPALRTELLQRSMTDQDARLALTNWHREHGLESAVDAESLTVEHKAQLEKLSAAIQQVDSENTRWLKKIVDELGWPTKTLVGTDGAHATWLLVQHADADPAFQRRCLNLMGKLPKGEVSQQDLAYLTDRVLLAEGKRQLYGTQFWAVNGKLQPRPLEDEAHVDQLRATVRLPPIADYIENMKAFYGVESK